LIHGPGCPVCVTPVGLIDQAIALCALPEVTLCSFGDMLRVPGSTTDLLSQKARGADVRIVYSPLDAVKLAEQHRDRQVVFFAVGFETTAPTTAAGVYAAKQLRLDNFSLLAAHVLVPPALEALLAAKDCQIDGIIAAGHVCTVMGVEEYHPLAQRFGVPIVVTGFEPVDLLQGITMCVQQLEHGRAQVENQYARVVQAAGNTAAQQRVRDVFEVTDRDWRGLGTIARSGLQLTQSYAAFDAAKRFGIAASIGREEPNCLAGLVLQGQLKPRDCPAFGSRCTPETPLGAPMVSAEGACAAYYRYRNFEAPWSPPSST
jgi:hydrogenase expression/formation protein HypD